MRIWRGENGEVDFIKEYECMKFSNNKDMELVPFTRSTDKVSLLFTISYSDLSFIWAYILHSRGSWGKKKR